MLGKTFSSIHNVDRRDTLQHTQKHGQKVYFFLFTKIKRFKAKYFRRRHESEESAGERDNESKLLICNYRSETFRAVVTVTPGPQTHKVEQSQKHLIELVTINSGPQHQLSQSQKTDINYYINKVNELYVIHAMGVASGLSQ